MGVKQYLAKSKVRKELQLIDGRIVVSQSSCDGCGECINVCPENALAMRTLSKEESNNLSFKGRLKVKFKGSDKAFLKHPQLCTTCGSCLKQCHENAIHIWNYREY